MFNAYEMASFAVYIVVVMAVGYHFFRQRMNVDDYLLGGKGMGRWVTAISAGTSDMSGWLMMGLPGAVYLSGMGEAWIAVGLAVGTYLNWRFVAPRLRIYTGKTDSLTLPHFFERRFGDPSGLLRILSALITLFFFTIYAASGLNAAAKLFESMCGVPFLLALCVGGVCIISYTFLGGYQAVCYTNLIQGTLMLAAVAVVGVVSWFRVGGTEGVAEAALRAGVSLSLWPRADRPVMDIVSSAAWGLGYFGMPHILSRFMSAATPRDLLPARRIAMGWILLCLSCAVAIGLAGVAAVPDLVGPEQETVFIRLARGAFHPLLAGIFLAAILAAIMSTIDSQLLVSASVLTEDLNQKFGTLRLNERQRLVAGRLGVGVISIMAMIIAADRDSSILKLVAYAWGGLGAAFGPVVIMALYSRRTSWQSALLGMWLGSVAVLAWERLGIGRHLYELIPGFFINLLAIAVGNRIWPETNPVILREFDEHAAEAKGLRI